MLARLWAISMAARLPNTMLGVWFQLLHMLLVQWAAHVYSPPVLLKFCCVQPVE